jgi:Family of unknown function (DUF6497)
MSDLILGTGEGPQVVLGDGAQVAVPSGQDVRFLDMVMNAPGNEGLPIRFRFVAPAIAKDGGAIDYDTATVDMEHLCNSFVLPKIAAMSPVPTQVVISFSATEVPFGETAPEVTQFFEAYRIEGGACIWEAF